MRQSDLMRYVTEAFDDLEVPYALVGSMACCVWGEARMTIDIDVVAQFTNQVQEFCRRFCTDEFYVSIPAAEDAVRRDGQFNIIHNTSGQKIDVMTIGNSPWSQKQIERRRFAELLEGVQGYVAAPEDIILGKLIYYREGGSDKHLRDIAGILITSGEIIDQAYLEQWVRELGVTEAWGDVQAWR